MEKAINWGQPEQAPHLSVVNVYVRRSIACALNVNDKIQWTSHSSFVYVFLGSHQINKKIISSQRRTQKTKRSSSVIPAILN